MLWLQHSNALTKWISTRTFGRRRHICQIKNILSTIEYAMLWSVVECYLYTTCVFLTQQELGAYRKKNGKFFMKVTKFE